MTTPTRHKPTEQDLRDLVTHRLDVRWQTFAEAHPHLAAAIDRVRLVDSAVERLANDPAYRAAMDAAARDEATLALAAQLITTVDEWIGRLLRL